MFTDFKNRERRILMAAIALPGSLCLVSANASNISFAEPPAWKYLLVYSSLESFSKVAKIFNSVK